MSASALTVLAGPEALAELREADLRPERVRALIGASGGPKWLVLHGLDRVLFPWVLDGARGPLHTVGSSIGSWRFACLGTSNPAEALDRFAEAYLEQRYSPRPTPGEVSREGERILERLLGSEGAAPLVDHPKVRSHIVTARFKHLGTREDRVQMVALGLAALANAVDRRLLGACVERVVFDSAGDPGPFAPWRGLPTRHVRLSADNLRVALAASAAIPGVMAGVVDPPDAPRGVYRDGGVADYHFGSEIDPPDGLALYPHFYTHLVPGWFDKALRWRRTRGLRRVVLIAPSAEHVAALPGGRIPDRNDFARMTPSERVRAWKRVLELGGRLGEAFGELVAQGGFGRVARPLP